MPALTKEERETFVKFLESKKDVILARDKGYIEKLRDELQKEHNIVVSNTAIYRRIRQLRPNWDYQPSVQPSTEPSSEPSDTD